MSPLRRTLETSLARLAPVGLLVTLVWPDWIEELTGQDLDGGSGEVELAVLAVLVVLTLTFAARAWWTLRTAPSSR